MRVAMIVGHFPRLSETFILNQITGLIDRGHTVDIYATAPGDLEKVHPDVVAYGLMARTYFFPEMPERLIPRWFKGMQLGVTNLHRAPLTLLRSLNVFQYGIQAAGLWLLYAAIPTLQQEPYDIVHCQFGTVSFWGLAFQQIHSPDARLITTFRGHDISSFVQERGKQIYRHLFRRGDFFLTNCEFFKRRLLQMGCDSHKLAVHYSGIDCDRFTFTPRYYPTDGMVRIATTGRLVEKKGIEYSIRAVAAVAQTHPNIEYVVIGEGPLRSHLEQVIRELQVESIVHLVGQKRQPELIEILDRSHLFIAPCVTAEDGNQDAPVNVLKEAMAMGLPVLSTRHGGIPELVEDGISGFLVPERDVDTLSARIVALIQHPEWWSEMGKAGRAYVETYYDMNHLNDHLVNLYQQMMDTPNLQPMDQRFLVSLKSIQLLNEG